ncbi:intermembrane lipid transfer protein VPS13A-like [Bacillus rossius redtenbacheri]|uniref:intermembrane lipid transfer protein VPS13A-like n=1 Tax=Bacillus rossius redtenbacheri TaxID=93214 RepID=UPI002FDC8D7B
MLEGVVATVLNRYLGKYVQDLDTENLNVGIFSGEVQLLDLRLKPEALYELDLPIEVKAGTVGRISLSIPWAGLTSQPVVITIEDVYVLAGPVVDRQFDPETDKRLMRAAKRRKLDALQDDSFFGQGSPDSKSFFEHLATTIMNNLQVFARNIHVRYEDAVSNPDCALACGLCVQSVSVETTNSKWKPSLTPTGASSLYQLLRLESLSVYWNPGCGAERLVAAAVDPAQPYAWRVEMRRGLDTFCVNGEDFEFVVKPVTCKVKVIVNKSNEARVPKLLVDFVLQDAATQLSRQQYLSIVGLRESLRRMRINRHFRQFHPDVPVKKNVPRWWKYAYDSVVQQRVRPYSWQYIKKHREYYRNYKDVFKQTVLSPNDTELKLDLQKLEDQLNIVDIVVAREHAKIELLHDRPELVTLQQREASWWRVGGAGPAPELKVQTERARGLWSQLSSPERRKLCETIGFVEDAQRPSKPKQYIEHKLNLTVANCAVSLLSTRREVLVLTLTQLLTSVETRPAAKAFKVSARAESFVLEGCSADGDLVPVITADNILTGNTSSNFFSIDFEKNPLNLDTEFGLFISLEPVEIIYHEHAVTEIVNFFQTRPVALQELVDWSWRQAAHVAGLARGLLESVLERRCTVCVCMDLKGPYFVIPELGSLQKGGSVLVVDLGRVQVTSDVQPSNVTLEDATQMELEERLYDRLHIDFSDAQLIFCDSGEEWREVRKQHDTDYHLVPKVRCQLVFSNSVKPDYRQLPRHKLNVSLTSVKLNLSDRKIALVLDLLEGLPPPSARGVGVPRGARCEDDEVRPDAGVAMLRRVQCAVVGAEAARRDRAPPVHPGGPGGRATSDVDKSCISSEHSDEETELWARTVDLPGFDDNVSPRNVITMLFRFILGEVLVQLSRSHKRVDKPYLMLRVSKVCWDTALMEYGPAVQASVGGVQLVDKVHTGCSGEYLELVSTGPDQDVATMLYRKVRSDCPDFKSHFHSVEQSLVVDFTSVSVVFHREAFCTLNKYLQYLLNKCFTTINRVYGRDAGLKSLWPAARGVLAWLLRGERDPPIPPGATKFSYSTRLGEVRVKLCDTELDLLELKVSGFESDCLFKANERMVLRMYLTTLTVDDLSDMTLYPKIVSIEEDKVFDVKYVRHSPKLYSQGGIVGSNADDVKSDGSLRLHVGRMSVVLLYKLLVDLQVFVEPFLKTGLLLQLAAAAWRAAELRLSRLRGWTARLHVSLDLHAPALLLPQKTSSPNLVILNLGDLNVENFFKEVSLAHIPYYNSSHSPPGEAPVIDNALVRLESVQMSRAVMTLAGSLEIQEPILEPLRVRLDVKRMVAYHHTVASLPPHKDLLLFEVFGGVENVRVNLGQRDLATLLAVWSDNLAEGRCIDLGLGCQQGLAEPATPTNPSEDPAVRKLQAFFSQSEQVRQEMSVRLVLDGLQVFLFSDMDEILSSPVRDMNHGLCKLDVGEATLSLEVFSDHSLEAKMVLQCCLLEDIRTDNSILIRKIFQSHGGERREDAGPVSVSTPPIVDAAFRQSAAGDRCLDVLVERTRLNLSVPFLLHVCRFLLDSLPGERPADGGVVNHGYVGDLGMQVKTQAESAKMPQRPPSSADSTSGYFSSGASCIDDLPGLSVSLQLRKPEVMVFADAAGHALLVRSELLLEYSRHSGRDSLVFSLAGLHVLSRLQGGRHASHVVLHPCDIEFMKSLRGAEDGLKVTMDISPISVHLSASTIRTVASVIEDITNNFQTDDFEFQNKMPQFSTEFEDLWSPKKIQPFIFADTSEPLLYAHPPGFPEGHSNELLTVAVPKVVVVFEMEDGPSRTPVVLFKSSAEASAVNWSRQLYMKVEVQLQASCYNEKVRAWEPLIEPVVEEEHVYRPWEVLIKVFQAKAFPLSSVVDDKSTLDSGKVHPKPEREPPERKSEESETSADETELENGMTFIRRHNAGPDLGMRGESVSLIGYPEDSDSDNEEGVLEKLATAIGHLFTGDSSDGEVSESEESSGAEPSVETEEASELTVSCSNTVVGREERAVFLKKHTDSVDSGLETELPDRLATYMVADARDRLEVTLNPVSLRVLHDLLESLSATRPAVPCPALESLLVLHNQIGPGAKVTLLSCSSLLPGDKENVLASATYEKCDSLVSSPDSATTGLVDASPTESDIDVEGFEGGFHYASEVTSEGEDGPLTPVLQFRNKTVTELYKTITDERLQISIEGFDPLQVLAPRRAVSKVHAVHPARNHTRYHLVVSNDTRLSRRAITVRSPLQVRNETSYAMGLYYKKSILDALDVEHVGESTNPFDDKIRVAIVEPDETFSVPLYVAYHCRLHILPAYVDSYHVSEAGLWWQELASDLNTARDFHCTPKEPGDVTVFSVRALCEEGVAVNRASRAIPNYLVKLLPPLAIHNSLPYAVEIKIPAIRYEVRIEAGEKTNVYFLNLLKMHKICVEVPQYLGSPWSGSFSLTPDLEEKTIAMTTEYDTEGGNKQLGLSLRVDRAGTCALHLHAPYWIINKTGLPLQIRSSLSDVVYEASGEEPLLFCYKKQRRRLVRVRAYHSSWSSAFSLDTAGCAGLVVWRDRERRRRYRVLLTVTAARLCPQLSRIVTLLPNFLVTNTTRRHLRFMEENERADLWIDLSPGQCLAFWPETDSMRMYVKFRDSKLVSQHFPITQVHQTVLRMDKGCGLCVDVSGGGEQPFSIAFRGYGAGDAPVRVDNLCEDLFLKIHQQDLGQVALLSPYQSVMYTWDDPCRDRVLLWNVYNNKGKGFLADIWRDGSGQERVSFHTVRQPSTAASSHTVAAKLSASLKRITPRQPPPLPDDTASSSSDDSESEEHTPQQLKKTRRDKVIVYWVSYLEGQQRVLLFTQDERIACQAQSNIEAEKSSLELFVSLRGVGLSLVRPAPSLPAVQLCPALSVKITIAWSQELVYLSLSDSAPIWEVNVAHRWKVLALELASWVEDRWRQDMKKAQMKDYVHVDFERMYMTKPFFGELRRRHQPAVWLQYRQSEHLSYLQCRLHRLQVDNQLRDAVFPTVLCPAAPVAVPGPGRRAGAQPCVQLAVMRRSHPAQHLHVYKFVKLLVQEFSLQVDRSFLLAVHELLSPWHSKDSTTLRIRADLAVVHVPISTIAAQSHSDGPKVVLEYMHVSPVKLQFSYSPHGPAPGNAASVLHYLLGSVGEVKAVKLKLAYLEQKGRTVSPSQQLSEVYSHFASQLVQQFHVLVLCVDVLGNPYSVAPGLAGGPGDFFYEPCTGVMECPEEFAEGLSHGAQVLLGHVLGGASSVVSLLSPCLGDLAPSLGFDQEYKKKRRPCLQHASDLPDSLLLSSRTFSMGVALGLSGILAKPVVGVHQEGVEGFFKGTGKGLMGLMTKQTGGVADCVGTALDTVKRACELGEDVVMRNRLPRFVNPYMGVQPFSAYEATGMHLLNTLSKGHYADTDLYWTHAALSPEGKVAVLVSLQHVFLVEKCRLWGPWEVEWCVRTDDVMAVPHIDGEKLVLRVRQDEALSFFSGDELHVSSPDRSVLEWLQAHIETVMVLNMEDKPCPVDM